MLQQEFVLVSKGQSLKFRMSYDIFQLECGRLRGQVTLNDLRDRTISHSAGERDVAQTWDFNDFLRNFGHY
jgi:hypothetical protein